MCLREFQGCQYVDVREHFLSGDDRQWHPTKKGIMLAPALLAQVIEGVEALEEATDLGTVATIEKSSREEIQVGVRQLEKHRYGEIRLWYWAREGGDKKPSSKGVTFRLDLVPTLLDALRDADEHLQSE